MRRITSGSERIASRSMPPRGRTIAQAITKTSHPSTRPAAIPMSQSSAANECGQQSRRRHGLLGALEVLSCFMLSVGEASLLTVAMSQLF